MRKTVINIQSGDVEDVAMGEREIADFLASIPSQTISSPRFVPLEFLDLFTESEQLAVAEAAMASAPVKLWYDRVLAATYITLDDPRVESGLDALVSAGLLSTQRKAAVMAAMEVAA